MEKKKKLIVVSGPSGVGKGTVLKEVLKQLSDIKLSVSCTTRKERDGEKDGENYFFISRDEFMERVKKDMFLEWAEFSGNCYGTGKDFVLKTLNSGNNVLLEIDTQGALQVKKKMPDCILIFIAPPSLEELEKRLRGRHTETEDAIQKRLAFVESELKNSKKFDFIVVNDDIQRTANEISEIINA